MAETIVENQICGICDADVRKGALFCYNCGGSVAPEIIVPKTEKVDNQDKVSPKTGYTENGKKISPTKLKDKPENEAALLEEIADKPISKPEIQPETKLKSAASLRKKSKTVQQKKVEIIWEEHEDAPNVWFVLTAILLTVFAGVIMWLALYFG